MIFNMTGGGSNPLNFQVKTYPSETELKADNPKENTIGIITTTTMTSWVFSATEPKEPEVGMVWIGIGTSSNCEFNALKKNTLLVYPLSAKQYVGNTFSDVKAFNYIGGEWLGWAYFLFQEGTGLKVSPTTSYPTSLVTVTDEAITYKGNGTSDNANLNWDMDFTPYSTIEMDVTAFKKSKYCLAKICNTDYSNNIAECQFTVDSVRHHYSLDVSSINETKRLCFPGQSSDHFSIHNLYLTMK